MRKTTWNTYKILGYTHDVANDQRSAGGIHDYQVRKGKAGWQTRIRQSNGRYQSFSAVWPISEQDGEAYFEQARTA